MLSELMMHKIKPVKIEPIITFNQIYFFFKYLFLGMVIAVCVKLWELMV
jgi:hypothetical protein